LTWYHDEPVVWPSLFVQYEVFRAAKAKHIKVMIDGQGADEVLAGYPKFYKSYFTNLIKKNPIIALKELYAYFLLHKMTIKNAFTRVMDYLKKDTIQPQWVEEQFMQTNFKRKREQSVRDVSLNLLTEVGLPALLHYEDRNSMACSIESRLPFLDYRLVELLINLPEEYKIHGAKRKYILREALKGEIPHEVYTRYDKMGYETPAKEWLQNNQEFVQKELDDAVQNLSGVINLDVKKMSDPLGIWRVIAFNRWAKVFDVQLL
jgi:asparagine synthase (glutamine-hydrolysing)